MKIEYIGETKEHEIEIYLTRQEIKKLFQEEGVIVKKVPDFLGDKRPCHFYIGNLFDKE